MEHRIHNVSKLLAGDHQVFVVTGRLPQTEEREEMDGYRVIRLPSRLIDLYNPPYIGSEGIEETLEELDPDLVDFHYRWAPSYTRAMRRFTGRKVFTYHNTFGEGKGAMAPLSHLNDLLQSRFLKGFDRVVCVSDFVRQDLRSRGFPDHLLSTVPNGVDSPREVPDGEEDFLLFLGRLVSLKGLHILIESMRLVDSRLIIAGSGPEERRLGRLVVKHGLEDRVELKGRVSEEEKERLLSSCKMFVLPSLSEAYGIAAAEAMAYGKPVVASSVGGLPEVVGDAGVLVPPRDPGSLARAIRELQDDPDLRHRLGRRARERAMLYSWERVAKEMESLYREVVEDR
ncbi:MAG: glycosyltransferase family 4 protein [Methanomassiliicoccales archaeon]